MTLHRHLEQTTTVDEYAAAFLSGQRVQAAALCGRVLRGKKPEDFTSLSDDPTRKVVMLMGAEGLSSIAGLGGRDVLRTIGYTERHIDQKLAAGNKFKLVVFPETTARLADWSGMLRVAAEAYPQVAAKLLAQEAMLRATTFQEIEAMAGYCFADVDEAGPSDHRFMGIKRYEGLSPGLVTTRAFLYHTLHMRELYSGDGYTYTPEGERGLKEFAIPNSSLTQLGHYALLDLDV